MDRNLPVNRPEDAPADANHRPPVAADRPTSVAFLPLALITFIIVAFTIAAWTFLSSTL